MTFETFYQLEEWRKQQKELFDQDGKRYAGTRLSDNEAETMLKLIDRMEVEIKSLEENN